MNEMEIAVLLRVSALAALLFLASSAEAASIKSQTSCSNDGEACATVGGSNDAIVRSLSFTTPANATAAILFHGSMTCSESTSARAELSLESQIVLDSAAEVTGHGPGGLTHVYVSEILGGEASFNLNSTRVVRYRNAGEKTVFFKIEPQNMPTFTGCAVTNATLSVMVTP